MGSGHSTGITPLSYSVNFIVPIPLDSLNLQVNSRFAGGELRKPVEEGTLKNSRRRGDLFVADDLGNRTAACSFRKTAQLAAQ